jgi:hypothetical protein
MIRNEKEVCKECPKRRVCVELIYSEICPSGLNNIPIEEARDYQAVWRGEKELCPMCEGKRFIPVRERREI